MREQFNLNIEKKRLDKKIANMKDRIQENKYKMPKAMKEKIKNRAAELGRFLVKTLDKK